MFKRAFDIIVSAAAIIVLAPPMAAIAAAIRLSSKGPAIFRQRRVGLRGKPFTMLKFRTMRAEVDPYDCSPQSSDDRRLTRLGRFLREKSLDELPQLFNVLVGQMSLVGPRPLYERQARQWNQRQRRRLEVKPGITGYAQVFGRAANTIEDKLELDVYYVEHRGLGLDMRLIGRTIAGMFAGRGQVYERRYSKDKQHETD